MAASKGKKTEKRNTAAAKMRKTLAKHAPEAVEFLLSVMRDGEQKTELRMKAAESILDRACGKATAAPPAEIPPAPPATVLFEGVLEEWSR